MIGLFTIIGLFGLSPSLYNFERFRVMKERASSPVSEGEEDLGYSFFTQKVDHFNPKDNSTFQQRYLYNDDYYDDSHMLIFYINGESIMRNTRCKTGFIKTLAEEYKADLVCLEHRFYGKSHPFDDLSNEHLSYLTSQQALADAAYFLEDYVNNVKKDDKITKVIVVGGSYTGAMSSWFRMLYPNLVIGSIASSAPVLIEEAFMKYDQHIASALGPECAANVRAAMDEIDANIETKFEEMRAATECTDIADPIDWEYALADSVAHAVQYNNNEGSEEERTIERLCTILNQSDASKSMTDRMFEFFNATLVSMNSTCLDFSTSTEILSDTQIDKNKHSRQWFYQTCREFGYFQVASNETESRARPLSIDLKYHEDICKNVFGVDVNVTETQQRYMQMDMTGTNIIWTNGDVDPWMELSITPSTPVSSTTSLRRNDLVTDDGRIDRQHWTLLLIHNGSHCSDLSTPQPTDSESLVNARRAMRAEINRWIDAVPITEGGYDHHSGLWIASMVFYGVGGGFIILAIILIVIACVKHHNNKNDEEFSEILDDVLADKNYQSM